MSRAQSSGVAALLSDYRQFAGRSLWAALALMILGAFAEGFGLLMIVPLATIAIHGGDPRLVRFAPGAAEWSGRQWFLAALGLFVAAMAARSLLLFYRDRLVARLTADYEASLRLRAAATLASRGWQFASRIGQAGMQSLLLTDVPRAAVAVDYIQRMASAAAMLAMQLALTLVLSPALTLVAVAFLGGAFLLSLRPTRRGVRSGVAIGEAMEQSAGAGFRLHAGLKAALAQGTVAAFLEEYRSNLRETATQVTRLASDYSASRQWAAFGAALAAAALLLVGVRLLALPFPLLVTSLVLFARMSGPAQQLQNSALQAAAQAPAFAAIERRLDKLETKVPTERSAPPLEWQRLTVDGAGFEHQPGLGLPPMSLVMKRGEWLGLGGPSGAGKTTLLDMVAGLLPPQQGAIEVDGQVLRGETAERWRAAIAYVGQEGNVFNDSVRGNLLAEGGSGDHVRLWQVLEIVGLAARVRAFPSQLEESVGDRGSILSGGERQRLILARALLRNPSLLILDEATAALDAAGEAALIERLKAIEPRPAAIVVAHRESTLAHCDSRLSLQDYKMGGAGADRVRGRNDFTDGSPRPR